MQTEQRQLDTEIEWVEEVEAFWIEDPSAVEGVELKDKEENRWKDNCAKIDVYAWGQYGEEVEISELGCTVWVCGWARKDEEFECSERDLEFDFVAKRRFLA